MKIARWLVAVNETDKPPGNVSAWRGWILALVLAEHDEAVAVGRIATGEGGVGSHRHLQRARGAPKLLNTIGVKDGPVASGPVVYTDGKEGMRTFDPDVVGIKVEGVSQLDTVPLEAPKAVMR